MVHLSADSKTPLGCIRCADLGIAQGSIQGVAYDTSDNTLWFVQYQNTSIRHVSKAGALLGTITSSLAAPNGITYDALDNQLVVGDINGGIAWISKASGSTFKNMSAYSAVGTADGLFFDPTYSTAGALYVSGGMDGEGGYVAKYDVALQTLVKLWQFPSVLAAEHIYLDGTTLYLNDDNYFHGGGTATNNTRTFTIDPLTPAIGSRLIMAGRSKYATPSATGCIVSGGNPTSSAGRGAGMYATTTANNIRFIVNVNGTVAFLDWTVPGGTNIEFKWYLDANLATGACSLYVNGTLVSTQTLSQTGSLPAMAWSIGAGIQLSAVSRFMALTQGAFIATTTTTKRAQIEAAL